MSWFQFSLGSKISPVALFIIVLVAVVLFVAALVHLLVRCISEPRPANSPDYSGGSTAGGVPRQLQQLFHLHDSGMDRASIDALPVFLYEDVIITGSKGPFDCAVCLCEFTEQDRLRLLPSCSHAFHAECIDTWLLSNSSCPLCRGAISSSGFSFENPFLRFEDWSKDGSGNSGLGDGKDDVNSGGAVSGRRVFSVRLGKFRDVNGDSYKENGENQEIEAGESSNFNGGGDLDGRRCFSMGSFQYVVADLDIQVELCPSGRGRGGGQNGNFIFDGFHGGGGGGEVEGKKIYSGGKGESFSVSKIWLWSKKEKDKFPSLP